MQGDAPRFIIQASILIALSSAVTYKAIMPKMQIVFWGATGQSKVLRELTTQLGYELVALFDNDMQVRSPWPGIPLFHGSAGFENWRKTRVDADFYALVAIGGSRGKARVQIQEQLEAAGAKLATVVHPAAYVATDCRIGKGSQILANATVGAAAKLGAACIVNTNASVDHECVLDDGVHIAPGATLAGNVTVGSFSMIGAGAVVLPGVKIGREAVVGAGAVVTRNIPDGAVAYGSPAKERNG